MGAIISIQRRGSFRSEEPLLVEALGGRKKDLGSRIDWVLMLSLLVLFALHPGKARVTPQISVRPQITCIMLSLPYCSLKA